MTPRRHSRENKLTWSKTNFACLAYQTQTKADSQFSQSAVGRLCLSVKSVVVVPTKKIGLQGILDYYVERTKQ